MIENNNRISFSEIFNETLSKENIILSFLIILELIKEEFVDLEQEDNHKITFFKR